MRWMDVEEIGIWKTLYNRLRASGNHEIAEYLKKYDVYLTNAPGVIGYATSPSEGHNIIVLNRQVLFPEGKVTAKAEMVCFHEMLHHMLKHIDRELQYIKSREPKIRAKLKSAGIEHADDMSLEQLGSFLHKIGNISADIDLSRYYNAQDIQATLELGGYLINNFPQFSKDTDFEDIYDYYLEQLEDIIKNQDPNEQDSDDNDFDDNESNGNGSDSNGAKDKELSPEFKAGWAKACKDVKNGKVNPLIWNGSIPTLQEAVSSDYEKGYKAAIKAMQAALKGNPNQKGNGPSGKDQGLEPLPINIALKIGDRGDENDKAIMDKEEEEREDRIAERIAKSKNITKEEAKELVRRAKEHDNETEKNSQDLQQELQKSDEKKMLNDLVQKIKIQNEREIQKQALLNAHERSQSISDFEIDLKQFAKTLEEEHERLTYSRPARRNIEIDDKTEVLKKGIRQYFTRKVPLINVYFDISDSFSSYVQDAYDAVDVLFSYKYKRLLDYNIYYVFDDIYLDVDKTTVKQKGRALYNGIFAKKGGTANGPAIMNHILETKPDNIVLMTDGDTNQGLESSSYMCPGKFWCITSRSYLPKQLLNNIDVHDDLLKEMYYL